MAMKNYAPSNKYRALSHLLTEIQDQANLEAVEISVNPFVEAVVVKLQPQIKDLIDASGIEEKNRKKLKSLLSHVVSLVKLSVDSTSEFIAKEPQVVQGSFNSIIKKVFPGKEFAFMNNRAQTIIIPIATGLIMRQQIAKLEESFISSDQSAKDSINILRLIAEIFEAKIKMATNH